MLEQAFGLLINEIAIDIGTAHLRVYAKGRSHLLVEPAAVITKQEKGKTIIVEYGHSAHNMLGRTPTYHQEIFPFQGGISDPKIAKELLDKVITQALGGKSFLKPRCVVGFSLYFQTQAQRTLSVLLKQSVGKDVQLIDSLICTALGCELPIAEAKAMMVLDCGYSGTEMGVLCNANIYHKHYLPLAGKHFNLAIQPYLLKKFQILLSPNQIETLKCSFGTAIKPQTLKETTIIGKHKMNNQPMELTIQNQDIYFALQPSLNILIQGLQSFFQKLSPRVICDLVENGVLLCGGSANLNGIEQFLQETLQIPVLHADATKNPMVMGAASLLKHEPYEHWLIKP